MERRLGRYVVLDELAAGGMARVHLGKLRAEGGFSRIVAIKVLHEHYARDAEFRSMFLDEARLVARVRHPNVVSTLDVLVDRGELFLVMDYIHGLPLSRILRDLRARDEQIPIAVVTAILVDTLEGLHAAHEALGDDGAPLSIVHRDVSPQNVMVGSDGLGHVVDFGVAHATDRLQRTIPGQIKGKASYMSPEQATGEKVDRRADVYAAGVVLWEALAGERLFHGDTLAAVILRQLQEVPPAPSSLRSEIPPELDTVALRGLAKRAADRFATAHEMAEAIERAVPRATRAEVAAWLARTEAPFFKERDELLARLPRESPHAASDRADADTLTEVPVERELPATLRDDAAVASPSKGTTKPRRRRVALFASAALLPALVGAALASRGAFRSEGSPPAPAAASTAVVAPAPVEVEPAPPPVRAPEPFPPAPEESASAAPGANAPPPRTATKRPSASARDGAADSTRRPPPACCTPDGKLQIQFHDCVDNCKN